MKDFEPTEFEALGIVIKVPIRRRNATASNVPKGEGGSKSVRRIARIVRRSPEVMVKVSGRAKGFNHLREHLNYITRNGELAAETSDGGLVEGRLAVRDVAEAWWRSRGSEVDQRRQNSSETVNMVLSMPKNTDRDKFAEGARRFAARAFAGNYDYLVVEHRDTDHPHVHLTVRTRGEDGVRLNPRKADLQAWREALAEELRAQGVEAEATPRRTRGVVQKPKRQAIKYLDMRNASRVQRAKVVEALRELQKRTAAGEKPWEEATRYRQGQIRKAWAGLADRFEKEGGEGVVLAREIRGFVAAMPPVETERDAMRRTVAGQLKARQTPLDR